MRELRNVLERACILTDSRIVSEREIASAMAPLRTGHDQAGHGSAPFGTSPTVNDPAEATLMSTAQREQIKKVLHQVQGNKAAAAKQLGISRRSLYRWIDRLGIPQ